MSQDSIVDEVRAIRDALAKEHGYDLKSIVSALKREGDQRGRQQVSRPPKRLQRPPDRRAG